MATESFNEGLKPVVTETTHDVSADDYRARFLSTFTAEDDKRIMGKVNRRFLLLIGLMNLVKQVDYLNAAVVRVLQIGQERNVLIELDMTANQYNWVQSIYFISYILFEIPSNLVLKRFTPRIWQSRIIFSWGVVLACHAAVQNKEGLYACRFFLGAMEAGMFPGLLAQLCSWYRSDEFTKPVMWMLAMQNCAGILGSILAYGISYMNGLGGLSAWRWYTPGRPQISILTTQQGLPARRHRHHFLRRTRLPLPPRLPQSPTSSKWLTEREQEYLELRLPANAPKTHEPSFNTREIVMSLKDIRLWSFCLAQVRINIGGYALQRQLPTVTTSLGYAGLPRNQLLNIPPAAATVLFIIFTSCFMSRAFMTRAEYLLIVSAAGFAFFVVLAAPGVPRGGIYVACVFGTMCYATYFIPFWAWRASTIQGATGAAFALSLQMSLGQIGGVVGPQLFQSRFAHNGYKVSFSVCAAFVGASWLFTLLTWWLTRKNEKNVQRVKRERISAGKRGDVYTGEDVRLDNARVVV